MPSQLDPDKIEKLKNRFDSFRAKQAQESEKSSRTADKVAEIREAMQKATRNRTRER